LVQVFIKSEGRIIDEMLFDQWDKNPANNFLVKNRISMSGRSIGGLTTKVEIKLSLKYSKTQAKIDFKNFEVKNFLYNFYTKDSWKEDQSNLSLQNDVIKKFVILRKQQSLFSAKPHRKPKDRDSNRLTVKKNLASILKLLIKIRNPPSYLLSRFSKINFALKKSMLRCEKEAGPNECENLWNILAVKKCPKGYKR
jgi:hypothetical protein